MFDLIPPIKTLGFEKTIQHLKVAEVKYTRGFPIIETLASLPLNTSLDVKRFYRKQPLLTTGLDGYEVLLRNLYLPLTKEKDIQEAFIFQAEPLLPYPIDQAILTKQTLNQSSEGTSLVVISVKKETMQAHLDQWQQLGIQPEKVACLQTALCQFATTFVNSEKKIICLHIQDTSTTAVLINEGKIIASFSQQEGFNLLKEAYIKDLASDEQKSTDEITLQGLDFLTIDEKLPTLTTALLRLKRMVAKMYFALDKELKNIPLEGILFTGEGIQFNGLTEVLFNDLPTSLIQIVEVAVKGKYNAKELLNFAVPIGLALHALPFQTDAIDFRQNEYVYPKPLKRLFKPLGVYLVGMLILSTVLYLFGQDLLKLELNRVKQNYVDLLASMGKTYDQFETQYRIKNPSEEANRISVLELDQQDLIDRLSFLQRDIHSTPDSFPLFANIPRVSDVLAWLSTHPAIAGEDLLGEDGKLSLENFNYTLVRRPEQTKKQEKYQVKVELEFSTNVPKLAREFHDALIAPNDFIDPKAEIKWNANRNNYKTSFYLKDKTSYL